MGGLWLRLYTETVNDPKVQKLPAELFKAWINLLCVAKEYDRDGELPSIDDLSFALRVTRDIVESVTRDLLENGLLFIEGNTNTFCINGWKKRQFISDDDPTSLDRKRRQRKKIKDVTRDTKKDVTQMSRVQRQSRVRTEHIGKDKHGAYFNVQLTQDELEKLKKDYPSKWDSLIVRLDEYIQTSGKVYKDHNLTMRQWAKKDGILPAGEKKIPDDAWRFHDPLENEL